MKTLTHPTNLSEKDGFALVLTMLVVLIVSALTTGAVIVGGNHVLANRYYERTNQLQIVANSGLEYGRALVNGDPTIYPDSSYATLEDGVPVMNGAGNTIPGVTRWLHLGPTGVTTGQYGIFGSVVSIVRDDGGGEVVRRSQISQESFAKFAYFTDVEPSNISFGGGDQIFGPVHSNSDLKIYSSGATFHQDVRTAQRVPSPQYGTFMMGYEEYVPRIEMPQTADLNKVAAQAAVGGTLFGGDTNGGYGQASTRIEFVAIDLNDDGDVTDDDEGFFRVFQSTNEAWVVGAWDSDLRNNENCGTWYAGTFVAAADHPYDHDNDPDTPDRTALQALTSSARRCYLGGDESITNGFVVNDGKGSWLPYNGIQAPGLAGRHRRRVPLSSVPSVQPQLQGRDFRHGQSRGERCATGSGDPGIYKRHHLRRRHRLCYGPRRGPVPGHVRHVLRRPRDRCRQPLECAGEAPVRLESPHVRRHQGRVLPRRDPGPRHLYRAELQRRQQK